MTILNTNNAQIDDQVTAKSEVSDNAAEQMPGTAPASKEPRQSKSKAKPAKSDIETSTATAKPAEGNEGTAKRSEPRPAGKTKPADAAKGTKSEQVLKKLHLAKGVTIETLMEATGWQAHSVRGFLSAVVKKKLGMTLVSEVGKDGTRRYRIDDNAKPE